jgi:hypothetical protein
MIDDERRGCPHTLRCNADPASCSLCLGIKAKRCAPVFRAEGFEVDQGVIDRAVDASNYGRRAPRAKVPTSDKERPARHERARAAAAARWERDGSHERASEAMLGGDVRHDGRELARKLRAAGKSFAEIADAIGTSTSTAKRWSAS